jgi:hypothetical protein
MTLQNCDDLPLLEGGLNDSSGRALDSLNLLRRMRRTAARSAMWGMRGGPVWRVRSDDVHRKRHDLTVSRRYSVH